MKSSKKSSMNYVIVAVFAAAALSCVTADKMLCIECTERYEGNANTVTVRERVLSRDRDWEDPSRGSSGVSLMEHKITKLVAVDNPHDKNVQVHIDCGAFEWDVVIKAFRTQFLTVRTTERYAYHQVCHVRENWFFTKDRPTYGPGSI